MEGKMIQVRIKLKRNSFLLQLIDKLIHDMGKILPLVTWRVKNQAKRTNPATEQMNASVGKAFGVIGTS